VAAVSAAVWFDFFLTQPYEQFTITRATDIETTVLILVLGVAVTELAVWGRRQHLAANRRAGYLENHGMFHGRFLMAADPRSHPTLEQRLVAVAFADQVGAALAVSQPVGH